MAAIRARVDARGFRKNAALAAMLPRAATIGFNAKPTMQ